MKGNTITLSLEEYKDLILKTVNTSKEVQFIEAFSELFLSQVKPASYDGKIEVESYHLSTELIPLVKYNLPSLYLRAVKQIEDKKAKEAIDKANKAKARAMKDAIADVKGGDTSA